MQPCVLLVDDSNVVLMLATAFLKGHYDVVTAHSGDEALAKAAAVQPQVILTDFNMPGRDGVEVARDLRANARTRHIPVVIMTTESELARIPRDLDHVLKPFDAESLLETVAAHLRGPGAH